VHLSFWRHNDDVHLRSVEMVEHLHLWSGCNDVNVPLPCARIVEYMKIEFSTLI
jgi:hypothetical protein